MSSAYPNSLDHGNLDWFSFTLPTSVLHQEQQVSALKPFTRCHHWGHSPLCNQPASLSELTEFVPAQGLNAESQD